METQIEMTRGSAIPKPVCGCKKEEDTSGFGSLEMGDSFLLPAKSPERTMIVTGLRKAQSMGYVFTHDPETEEDRLWLVRKKCNECTTCGEELFYQTAAE